MSFLYPRTVTITRPISALSASGGLSIGSASQAGGTIPYIGNVASAESAVTGGANLPCSIQAKAAGRTTVGGALPSDAPGPVMWMVFVPKNSLAKGAVLDRDILTDDEGNRYQVKAAYWNSLGYSLSTVRLEA